MEQRPPLCSILLGVAATLLFTSVFAQEEETAEHISNYMEIQHGLSMEFQTPHTRWAKPYTRGPLRAVFFETWFQGSTEAREIVELMQRLDLNASAAYVLDGQRLLGNSRPEWYGGDPEAGTRRALTLLDEPNELIVINQVSLEALPPIRDRIQEKVSSGAGLVFLAPPDKLPFGPLQPVPASPAGAPRDGTYYQFGKGRVAVLPARKKLEYQLGWETDYDYQVEQQIRAALWAANKEPAFALGLTLPAKLPRGTTAQATLRWGSSGPRPELKTVLRRWDGVSENLPLKKGRSRNSAVVNVPIVREGKYHLDVFASRKERVENWATTAFEVQADRHVAGMELDEAWAEPGTKLAGRVRCSGNLRPSDSLRVRLVDQQERILAEKVLATAAEPVRFSFPAESWMPMLLRVEAAILDGGNEVSANHAYVRVTRRHQDQFNFVIWNAPSGDLAPYGLRSLARWGATAILQGGPPPLSLAANNLSYVPYATSFRDSSHTLTAMLDATNGVLKSGCVYDGQRMFEKTRQVAEGCRAAREHGVLV